MYKQLIGIKLPKKLVIRGGNSYLTFTAHEVVKALIASGKDASDWRKLPPKTENTIPIANSEDYLN